METCQNEIVLVITSFGILTNLSQTLLKQTIILEQTFHGMGFTSCNEKILTAHKMRIIF